MKFIIPLYILATSALHAAGPLDVHKITWTTPSQDSVDSMPLSGRLGAGANVWVQDGCIWLYLAHNGAYDEHGRLLKLGCVRLTPKDVKLGDAGFVQELDPATGTITIRQGEFKAALWFAGETLVYESETGTAAPLEVAFGTWREKTKDGIRNDMMGAKTTFTGDQITPSASGFLWFHRNADYPIDLAGLAKSQGTLAGVDAGCHRTPGFRCGGVRGWRHVAARGIRGALAVLEWQGMDRNHPGPHETTHHHAPRRRGGCGPAEVARRGESHAGCQDPPSRESR